MGCSRVQRPSSVFDSSMQLEGQQGKRFVPVLLVVLDFCLKGFF